MTDIADGKMPEFLGGGMGTHNGKERPELSDEQKEELQANQNSKVFSTSFAGTRGK